MTAVLDLLHRVGVGFDRPDWLWALLLVVPMAALAVWTKRRLLPIRKIVAFALRALVLLALVLALAGVTRLEKVDDLAVVFVLDRSASVGADGMKAEEDFVREALKSQRDNDVAGVVAFGSDALLDVTPRDHLDFRGVESTPSPHQSDLAAGVRLAAAVLPSDHARRVVLLTDGEETKGDVSTQVLLTAGKDLEVAVVPIGTEHGPEVLLEDLLAPGRVDEGASFDVRVVARSDKPTTGKLRLYRNDQYLGEMPVTLEGGRAQVITVRQQASDPGLYRYRAKLEVDDPTADGIVQNNEVVGSVQVTGRPRVLYAEGYPEQSRYLKTVLEKEGLVVDVVGPGDFPPDVSGLRPYSAVVLSDIPAYQLTSRQQEAVQSYVRDLGRGLVMVGGDQSFGLGGYYKTPIEEALPVRMDIQDKTRFPKLAMVHAIDKSCSMGEGAGSKLAMAQEAAIDTAQLLNERDELGVIGFDDTASWIVPLQPLADKQGVIDTIGSLRVGGGTDIFPALQKGIDALEKDDSALKHAIVMSDGITAEADFQTLITGAAAHQITVSTIAIGDDADRATMQQMASWGGGQFYLVTDPTAIPAIFTREMMLASRSFLVEEDFRPATKEPSELLRGFDPATIPTLHGYVGTEIKPRATLALEVPDEHPSPLLAHWHYGLGRSVAFTSDCKTRWSKDWVGSESYTQFWTQVMRWTVGDPNAGSLQVESEIKDGSLEVTVDAFDSSGSFQNFLDGEARVIAPDLSVHPLPLKQVAPGRYKATMPVDQDGSWLVGVAMKQGDEVVGQSVTEAVQPYSPEYRKGGAGKALIGEVAQVGGGGVLSDPAAVFAPPKVAREVPHPLWPALIVLAALLLLLDVASRRIEWTRAPQTYGGDAVLVRPAAIPVPRAKPKVTPKPAAKPDSAPAEPEAAPEPEPVAARTEPEPEPDSYAGRLMASKRSARKKMGGEG